MAPVYFLAQGSPYVPALIILLLNALGTFTVFFIGKNIYNEKIGLWTAFLYAISFEQTQYALFFSHPGMALPFVLLYYLGLSLLVFKNNSKGLILSAFCAGIATQFHFSLIILVILLPFFALAFKPKIRKIKIKDFSFAIIALAISMSTFIVAELKFKQIFSFITTLGQSDGSSFSLHSDNFLHAVNRYINDNVVIVYWSPIISLLIITFSFWYLYKKGKKATAFLLIWFLIGCIAYLTGSATTYYYGIGGSVSLLIVVAFGLTQIWLRNKNFAAVLLFIIIASNLFQITTINPKGPIDSVMAPPGLLLTDEQRAIDFIYQTAGDEKFSIHGLTIPFNVKSTWDYLFNWYGMKEYGFVPVWGGEDALGSEGTLKVVRARSELPSKQFLIIEPLVGLPDKFVKDFFQEESYFTNLISEEKFGAITVQVRKKY